MSKDLYKNFTLEDAVKALLERDKKILDLEKNKSENEKTLEELMVKIESKDSGKEDTIDVDGKSYKLITSNFSHEGKKYNLESVKSANKTLKKEFIKFKNLELVEVEAEGKEGGDDE